MAKTFEFETPRFKICKWSVRRNGCGTREQLTWKFFMMRFISCRVCMTWKRQFKILVRNWAQKEITFGTASYQWWEGLRRSAVCVRHQRGLPRMAYGCAGCTIFVRILMSYHNFVRHLPWAGLVSSRWATTYRWLWLCFQLIEFNL